MKKYIRANGEIKYPTIIDVTPMYTGGGIYVYWGAFSDGKYFIASTPYWDLQIVDANPVDTYNPEFKDFDADQPSWQDAHHIMYVDSDKTQDFFNEVFDWILKNKPNSEYCNYSLGDMEEQQARNNNETDTDSDRMHTEA